ncbi:exodeoxyribonuclease III [soil metagenome]
MFCVVSANVNGVRAAQRRGGLASLAKLDAEVICLQEVRADEDQLRSVLADSPLADYQVAHAPGSAGRAGVAVLTRQAPLACRVGLPGFEGAGRWIEVDLMVGGDLITALCTYVHTGEAGTERQLEKFRFLDAIDARLAALASRAGADAVLTGDLNIAHRQADLKNWKGNLGKAGFLPQEQAYLDRWLSAGWTDLQRLHAGEGPGPYTWWSWRGKAFDTDTGWRIDYQLASAGLAARSVKVEAGRAASYAERWSDHAPVIAWFA